MKELDIGQVANISGLKPSALRYYEKKGLIQSIGRNGLRRQYNIDVIDQLKLIMLGRLAGFTLDEITQFFGHNGRINIDRQLVTVKAATLDNTIRQLSKIRDGLRHIANCPEQSHIQCPEFRKILDRTEF